MDELLDFPCGFVAVPPVAEEGQFPHDLMWSEKIAYNFFDSFFSPLTM